MTMAWRATRRSALLGVLAVLPTVMAQDTVEQDALLEPVVTGGSLAPEVAMRHGRIRAELDALAGAHPWAGEYSKGDGRGFNVAVAVAPDAGVATTLRGCMGLYDQAEGAVIQRRRNGNLVFDLGRHGDDMDMAGPYLPDKVLPLRWSGRRYLLEPDALGDFVDAVHDGREPRFTRQGRFLLGDGDHLKPVDGPPPLPEWYRRLLLTTPRQVAVLEVGEPETMRSAYSCEIVWSLRLDAGRRAGLFKGMTLRLHRPARWWSGSIEVTDVAKDRATAYARQFLSGTTCESTEPMPAADWVLDTGAFDRDRANAGIADAARRASATGD